MPQQAKGGLKSMARASLTRKIWRDRLKKSNKNLKEGWSLSLIWGCCTVSLCLLTDLKGCSDRGERTQGCHAVALLKAPPPAAARRRRTEVVLMTRVIVKSVAMDCQHRVLESGQLFHGVRHPVKVRDHLFCLLGVVYVLGREEGEVLFVGSLTESLVTFLAMVM